MNIQDIILLVILTICTVTAILTIIKGKNGCCYSNCDKCHSCSKYQFCHALEDNIHKEKSE